MIKHVPTEALRPSLHPSLHQADMPARLHLPIRDVLRSHETKSKFRQSALTHDFFTHSTLAHILEAPEQMLREIQLIPRLGVKTLALLKLVISDEIALAFPAEWRRCTANYSTPSILSEKLALFRKIFAPVQDVIPFHAEYYSQAFSDANLNAENTFLRDAASDFLYVCVSLPEPLKTPAVLALETPEPSTANYGARMQDLLQTALSRPLKGCILMDSGTLMDLATRSGPYRSMTPEETTHQISILRWITQLPHPDLHIRVTDYKKHQISTGFLGGEGILSVYLMGGYLRTEDPSMIRLFRDQVTAASKAGVPAELFLESLPQT